MSWRSRPKSSGLSGFVSSKSSDGGHAASVPSAEEEEGGRKRDAKAFSQGVSNNTHSRSEESAHAPSGFRGFVKSSAPAAATGGREPLGPQGREGRIAAAEWSEHKTDEVSALSPSLISPSLLSPSLSLYLCANPRPFSDPQPAPLSPGPLIVHTGSVFAC
jgi:hypothetical protein